MQQLGLFRLPLSQLRDRPPEFASLSSLAWYVLWIASHGYGLKYIRRRWQGGRTLEWSTRVRGEITRWLGRRTLAATGA